MCDYYRYMVKTKHSFPQSQLHFGSMVYKKKNSNLPEDSLLERLELEFKTCGLISICMTLFC